MEPPHGDAVDASFTSRDEVVSVVIVVRCIIFPAARIGDHPVLAAGTVRKKMCHLVPSSVACQRRSSKFDPSGQVKGLRLHEAAPTIS